MDNSQIQNDQEQNDVSSQITCDMLREIGINVPSNTSTVSEFISNDTDKKCEIDSLRAWKQLIGQGIQSLIKYYNSTDISKEKAKENFINETKDLFKLDLILPPATYTCITSIGAGAGTLLCFILCPHIMLYGGIFGAILGIFTAYKTKECIYNYTIPSRNELLVQAEKDLNLHDSVYNQELLELVYKEERPTYHPDKYHTQLLKAVMTKKFIKVETSYQIIKKLKGWQ
ncbi:hypothetical protein ABPG74_000880 [Tetrahymena malaccensis]